MGHPFQPDEHDPLSCAGCSLPAANARHRQTVPATRVTVPTPSTVDEATAHARRLVRSDGGRATVVRLLAEVPSGMTDDELCHRAEDQGSKVGPNTLRPRRIDLAREGLVVQARDRDGREQQRKTSSGKLGAVWVLAPAMAAAWAAESRTAGVPA